MTHNFTVRDIEATSVAFALFALFTVIPGYVVGALLNIFAFNQRTLLARVAISISLSIAIVPIAVYLCWLSVPAVPWLLCAAAWLALPFLLMKRARQRILSSGPLSKPRAIVLAILAAWVVLGAFCLIDLQIGHRLYVSVNSYDYILRAAFTAAIDRTGVPPTNPYFYPGHGYIMRYHYFWYMLCSLVARFGGPFVTARIAVIAGTLWVGIGLVAILTQYVGRVANLRPIANRPPRDKQTLIAVALLSVTGLDILPNALTFLLSGRFNASIEWWNEPIASWVGTVIWQPHTIASLIAWTAGFLVVWDTSKHAASRARLIGASLGAAAFASGLGLSIYVSFVFGIFLMVWMVILLFRRRRTDAAMICIAGVLALALSAPYIFELSGKGSANLTGAPPQPAVQQAAPIAFTIRSFYFAEALASVLGFDRPWQIHLVNALALPLNYFLEFGFFLVVGIKQWKRIRNRGSFTDEDACGVAMVAVSVILCTFLRSNTISNNDLGWRGILIAQFVLLIWAADLWENGLFPARRVWFSAVGVMLVLGVAATAYDVVMLRIYPILLDDLAIPRYHWLAPDHNLGERTYALRQVYEKLSSELPKRAIVQQNPNASPGDLFYGLYADRQTAAETESCGVVFGGPASLCPGILTPINQLFASSNLDSAQVDMVCRNLSIDALVVKDTDSVWQDKTSWVWAREPLMGNAYARAFLCGR